MKISKIINAAIGATRERKFVNRNFKKPPIDSIDKTYYDKLIKTTGAPADDTLQNIKNWYKAYKLNIKRQNMIENLNKPFKRKTTFFSIIKNMFG